MTRTKRYQTWSFIVLLVLFTPASWARHGGGAARQAAVFQDEVEQMVDVFETFRDNHPYRRSHRLNAIENQLDRLNGVAARLARSVRNGRLRRARQHKDAARRIVRNTSNNLNAVNVSRHVRRQWRKVKSALHQIRVGGYRSEYMDDDYLNSDHLDGDYQDGGSIVRNHPYILDDDDDTAGSVTVHPQPAANIGGLVDQIEDLSERVKNTFRKTSKRKQSWEKTLDGQLSAFDQLANQLRDRWKSQHTASAIRATVNALSQKSSSIHAIISRYPVNSRVKSYWRNLKSQLDQLNASI